MNHTKCYTLLWVLIVLLTSCDSSENNFVDHASNTIEIQTSIVSTRVNTNQEGKGYFTLDDQILVFATANTPTGKLSRKLTLTENKWSPSFKWSELDVSNTILSSFYPANSSNHDSDSFIHSVATVLCS